MSQPLIVIPARMASTRLPGKPLAMIGDVPMIVQVWRRAMEAKLGPVVVACDGPEIAEAIANAGGNAVLTDPALPSGSDRVWAAVQAVDPDARHPVIINLQGDLPTLDPKILPLLVDFQDHDITTLVAPIVRAEERTAPSVVKPVLAMAADGKSGRALYFSRASVPHGEGMLYHHIGVYGYKREALQRFVSLPPSKLELREKLEQLRALEAGMRIRCMIVDTVPLGVDTAGDLETARSLICRL
jgi:3-deoxy-manno-octulosonate cytidylyltransferase (CMP-KDO synthetase)